MRSRTLSNIGHRMGDQKFVQITQFNYINLTLIKKSYKNSRIYKIVMSLLDDKKGTFNTKVFT
jgi:hypothetical protein